MMGVRAGEALPRLGARIVLRRLTIDDLPHFQSYRNDPAVGKYQGWLPQPDAEAVAFLTEMAAAELFCRGTWVQVGIADRTSGVLMGDVGIRVSPTGREAEIGFTLHPQAHGRGLGTEAVFEAIALLFEHTCVDRIIAIADSRNLASIRLLERLRMQRVAAQGAMFRGEPCVEFTYAVGRVGQKCNVIDRRHLE